jgi:hypothetical protein
LCFLSRSLAVLVGRATTYTQFIGYLLVRLSFNTARYYSRLLAGECGFSMQAIP